MDTVRCATSVYPGPISKLKFTLERSKTQTLNKSTLLKEILLIVPLWGIQYFYENVEWIRATDAV